MRSMEKPKLKLKHYEMKSKTWISLEIRQIGIS